MTPPVLEAAILESNLPMVYNPTLPNKHVAKTAAHAFLFQVCRRQSISELGSASPLIWTEPPPFLMLVFLSKLVLASKAAEIDLPVAALRSIEVATRKIAYRKGTQAIHHARMWMSPSYLTKKAMRRPRISSARTTLLNDASLSQGEASSPPQAARLLMLEARTHLSSRIRV